ncbi:MAG: ribosome maturation factor RimM [Christensenellales bacterium]|jgi:16S rRNA processing protein RimM
MQNKFLEAVKILKPHGIHGEVKAFVLMDTASDIAEFDVLFIKNIEGFLPVRILKSRVQGEFIYLQLEGVSDRNSAEKLRDTVLYFDRTASEPLPNGRFFIADIIGCEIVTQENESIGVVADVLQPGANDVFVVKSNQKELLIPVLSKLIIKWLIKDKKIIVDKQILLEVCLIDN